MNKKLIKSINPQALLNIAKEIKEANSDFYLSDVNERLQEEGCKIFLEDRWENKLPGEIPPKKGQIIMGRTHFHFQKHIGIVIKVKNNKDFDYVDLTKKNRNKAIELEFLKEIPQKKIDKINEEFLSAYKILEQIYQERKEKAREKNAEIEKKERSKINKALNLV